MEMVPSRRPLSSMERSWIRRPEEPKKKKKRTTLCLIFAVSLLTAVILAGISKTVGRRHSHTPKPRPDNYTAGLQTALIFFDCQKSGKLPIDNNITWRGDSGLNDSNGDLVGGFYNAGDAMKYTFPMAYAMTMLSWSVIEYSPKYAASGELSHVKELIKWGTRYLLKTFNSSDQPTDAIVEQVGSSLTGKGNVDQNDHFCWMRPEDVDYQREVVRCYSSCSSIAAEMAAALASASIVFREDTLYAQELVQAAKALYEIAYDDDSPQRESTEFYYKSSQFWDELLWGGCWLYYATGETAYLERVTTVGLATKAGAFRKSSSGVFSWDNKLPAAQLLLTRLRLFLSPPYPYEGMLKTFDIQTGAVMCSYLPYFNKFNRTKGGLLQLNHGDPQPLQYVANAAFLATLYSDYLDAANTPGWFCGPHFYTTHVLREFARSQIDYILWKNPQNMSYLVGFGPKYPQHVHHRGASIPKNNVKYNCTQGWEWRDSNKPNPNTLVGAMVAGPDNHDGFQDVRMNYNYTEPTLAGNAGLVAALVALSSDQDASCSIDKNTIFSAVPPMSPSSPPPPESWRP